MDRRSKTTQDLETVAINFLGAKDWSSELEALGKVYQNTPETALLIPEKNPDFDLPEEAKMLAYAANKGMNVYVQGPVGCGKTDGVEQVLSRMKRPCKRINMNGDATTANFIGQMKANAQGTYYDYGVLPLAMKGGYPLLCDEIDFTPPQIGAILHPVLESKKVLFIPDTNETIHAQPGFCVFATANTGGKGDGRGVYTGTEILNTAMLDRFPIKLNWSYLTIDRELSLISKHTTVANDELAKLVKVAAEIRTAFMQGNLSVTFSTRKLLDYIALRGSFPKEMAVRAVLLNWLDVDDEPLVQAILNRVGFNQE